MTKRLKQLIQIGMISIIKLYRVIISPFLGQRCRFYPSCSHYAEEALRKHNIFRAIQLIIWRLLRCQPFCEGGIDPVPESKRRAL